MTLEIIIKSIILGIVEGLTEFIPVSSTAHLLLTSKILDFYYIENGVFEIAIQLGAILAICFLYRQKMLTTALSFHKDQSSRNFSFNIIIAFLPAVVFGMMFYGVIKSVFFAPFTIAIALIIGGLAIMIIEKKDIKPKVSKMEDLSKLQALYVGLFQTIAMIPGVSRSGATIMGGLLLRLDRKTATEFSFFLAIPTIFGAVFYDLYKNWHVLDWQNFEIIFIGLIVSFLSSLVVIKWLIKFVSSNNFMIFAYYRIAIGLIILSLIYIF